MSRPNYKRWLLWAGTLATRENDHILNQADLFSHYQISVQRSLAISSSSISIFFCLAAIYCFLAIDPRRLVFRHHLIAFLLLFDLLKAFILLLYPARVLTHPTAYANQRFCQVVGFFTTTAIEGADLAILTFALHTLLLIFKPNLSVKVLNSGRVEGGMYKYRYYVYGLSFVIPLFMASLAYIGVGYQSFVCWCYLPQQPVWYRLVLSWVPRYCIIVIIILIYGLIYYYVLKEFKALGGVFTTMQHHNTRDSNVKPSFFSSLKFFFINVKDGIYDKFFVPNSDRFGASSSSENSAVDPVTSRTKTVHSLDESPNNDQQHQPYNHTNNIMHDPELEAANLANFRKRQKLIERQMKSIFVYPIAYVSVWLFPFILQCTQFNYERTHGAVIWLNYLGAFMQPFNGFVDSMVFFYREEPWKYTIMKNYEKDNAYRLDNYVRHHSGDLDTVSRRRRLSSYSAAVSSDVQQYSWWRRLLGKLRLPLMGLPTEENITKFQNSYLSSRFEELRSTAQGLGETQPIDSNGTPDFKSLMTKHDFSNLLTGDLAEGEFRLALDNYSLNFQRRSSHSSQGGKHDTKTIASASNKSSRSRRFSAMDPHEPIPESKEFTPQESHANPRKSSSYAHSKRPSQQRSDRSGSIGEDVELDFLQFLRDGH